MENINITLTFKELRGLLETLNQYDNQEEITGLTDREAQHLFDKLADEFNNL